MGPYSGGKHQFMTKGHQTLRLPNPHQADIGREFLARILRQGEIEGRMGKALNTTDHHLLVDILPAMDAGDF